MPPFPLSWRRRPVHPSPYLSLVHAPPLQQRSHLLRAQLQPSLRFARRTPHLSPILTNPNAGFTLALVQEMLHPSLGACPLCGLGSDQIRGPDPDPGVVCLALATGSYPVSSTGQALNIHRPASLYETFPVVEARRVVKRLEFHHTPKHASWLNLADIEFSVLSRDFLQGRHGDEVALAGAIYAYEIRRNAAQATIHWRVSTEHARCKLLRLYPCKS